MKSEELKNEEEVLNELESTEIGGGIQDEETSEDTTNYVCPENGYCPKKPEKPKEK
jgi:hypothetical protein